MLEQLEQYIKGETEKLWEPGVDWVQYAGPYFDEKEKIAAIKAILDGWLVLGEDAIKFERRFPKYFGKKHGILTNSGSSSNLLMVAALSSKRLYNLPKGTKIITPVAGFPTTVNPIIQYGYEPVFVDIELQTLNLDLDQVEEAAKNGAKVLMHAHVLGNPPNMDRLMKIVEEYDLIYIEDCCDALNSFYDGKPLGSFGDMASCSFYPAHHITMGEGGFVSCKTGEMEVILRSFREWGRGCYCVGKKANLLKNGTCKCRFSNWIEDFEDEVFDHKYIYDEIGYNMKPIELQASMGLVQLEKLDEITTLRKRNYHILYNIFKPYEQYFILPEAQEKSDVNWFAFPLTVKDGAPFKRSNIVDFLETNKIQTRPYFAGNILLQPAYKDLRRDYPNPREQFPNASKSMLDTFFLGTSPVITEQKLTYVKEIVDNYFALLDRI